MTTDDDDGPEAFDDDVEVYTLTVPNVNDLKFGNEKGKKEITFKGIPIVNHREAQDLRGAYEALEQWHHQIAVFVSLMETLLSNAEEDKSETCNESLH